MKSKDMNINTN